MTNWTPDLTSYDGPLYRRIADALANAVATGTLPAGSRLPTHRDLAHRLGVTVGTVTRAYAEADRRGLIGGEVGRGTYVRERREPTRTDTIAAAHHLWRHPPASGQVINLSICLPFVAGVDAAVARITAELQAEGALPQLLGYGVAAGLPHHRDSAARWLRRQSGLTVDPDTVLLTIGAQNAMAAALMTLVKPGDVVASEGLAYPGVKTSAAALGLHLEPLPLDEQGLDPEAFDHLCRRHRVKLLYTVPTLQNPTTVCQPLARRRAVIEVARRHGVLILEDDVFGFLVTDAPPALHTLAPDLTVYINSLSKNVAPGLRFGFLVAPAALVPRLESALRTVQFSPPLLMAEIAHRLMEDGDADRFAETNRVETRARQAMARALLPADTPFGTAQGHHLWLPLPTAWRRERFVEAALSRGVAVTDAEVFAIGQMPVPHAVRLGLSTPLDRADLTAALQVLGDLLTQPPPAPLAIV